MATLKRVLSGTLGKGLLEYEFPKEAYEEGGSQAILYEALQSKLEDETAVTTLMEQIVRNMDYVSTLRFWSDIVLIPFFKSPRVTN